jgi:hypothetical protein
MTSNHAEAGFLCIMSVAFAITGWRTAKVRNDRLALWNAARNWPTVSGKLLKVGVDVVTKSHNVDDRVLFDTYYRPRIAYSYSVGSRPYNGTKFDCTDSPGSSQKRTRARISKYRPGDSANIAYDPADPCNSVLDPAIRPDVGDGALSIYLEFIAAGFLLIAGVRILIYAQLGLA